MTLLLLFAIGLLGLIASVLIWRGEVIERFEDRMSRQYQNTILYDVNGKEIRAFDSREDRRIISLDDISPFFIQSVITIEDRRFFSTSWPDVAQQNSVPMSLKYFILKILPH